MAIKSKNKIYRGFSTVANSFGNYKLYDIDLVKQDLLNQLNIRKGECVMFPNYGTIIWNALFEPLTDELKYALVSDLKDIIANDPRVQLDNLDVIQYEYGLQFEISLTYLEFDLSQQFSVAFNKNGTLKLI